jgi:CHAT domain-containing protein/tetratricopeptide (TPR) repeat protein
VRTVLSLVVLSLLLGLRSSQPPESPYHVLQRARYFSDLYNWRVASPMFASAERALGERRDHKGALYAHIGALTLDSNTSIRQQSGEVARLLATEPALTEDRELRLFALVVKGTLDRNVDQVASRSDWEQVQHLARDLQEPKWIYRAEGDLGLADYYDGNIASSERRVTEALLAAARHSDFGAEVFFSTVKAGGYLLQKLSVAKAMAYANQAIRIARDHPDIGEPKVAFEVLTQCLVGTGKAREAEQLVAELLKNPSLDSLSRLDYLNAAGDIAMAENNPGSAIRFYNNGIAIAKSRSMLRDAADLQASSSLANLAIGNLDAAEQLSQESCDTTRKAGTLPLLPGKLDIAAQVLVAKRRFLDADKTYRRAEEIQDDLFGQADSFTAQTAIVTAADRLYAHHFALSADHLHDVNQAFGILEQGRARALANLLTAKSPSDPRALSGHTLSRSSSQSGEVRSSAVSSAQPQAALISDELEALTSDLSFSPHERFRPVTIPELQGALQSSDVVLEYVISDPLSYVVAVTPSSRRITTLPPRAAVAESVNAFRIGIERRSDTTSLSRTLYDELLGSIPEVGSNSNLIIIPDGPLNLVPFEALKDENNRYVVERHVVSYAPSSTALYLMRSRVQAGTRAKALLAVGGIMYDAEKAFTDSTTRSIGSQPSLAPLANSKPEIRAAENAIRSSSNVVLEAEDATKTNVKRALEHGFGYIHFAVHAVSGDNPDRASLIMRRDPSIGDDGSLTASEIIRMRLPANLVVLSACDTNVGPIQGEEGVSALSTAFLIAGARTVVSTLWPIEDAATLVLMKAFYAQVAKGVSTAEALTRAKRDLLARFGAASSPIYWAGFIVQGSALPS